MDEQNCGSPFSGILSNRKVPITWMTLKCIMLNKRSQSHGYMPYRSIYITCWKRQNSRDRDQWLIEVRGGGSSEYKGRA